MTDIHCHLLPYVDDGAHTIEEAEKLLEMEAAQGVTHICLTPHLRKGMFEMPDEGIVKQFERLKPIAAEKGIRLSLSREYHWDGLTYEKLKARAVMPIGKNVMLTEFSAEHSGEQMLSAAKEIRRRRYIPLIAHVERYEATDDEMVRALRSCGALIQINADAVLGHDGRYARRLVWKLLTDGLVDVIASDAHSTDERPPRLAECYGRIAKKLGEEPARKMMHRSPMKLIRGKYHGG
mgnify:CR=1 FL=1